MSKTSLDPKHFGALRKFKAGIFKVLAHPKAGFLDQLGRENVCANIDLALSRSREILSLPTASKEGNLAASNQS